MVGTTRTFAARKLRNSLVAERRLSRSILRRCLASRYRKKCADANRGCVCNSQRDSSTDILTRSSISFVLLIRSTTPPPLPSLRFHRHIFLFDSFLYKTKRNPRLCIFNRRGCIDIFANLFITNTDHSTAPSIIPFSLLFLTNT